MYLQYKTKMKRNGSYLRNDAKPAQYKVNILGATLYVCIRFISVF